MDNNEVSRKTIYFFMFCKLFFGTTDTFLNKLQDRVVIGLDAQGNKQRFHHPFLQSLFLFAGESFCLLYLKVMMSLNNKKQPIQDEKDGTLEESLVSDKGPVKKIDYRFYLLVTAMCDLTGTIMVLMAMSQVAVSVYQMMRGSLVVVTAIYSVVFLKRKLFLFHWLSLVSIVIGLAIVGYVNVKSSATIDKNSELTPTTPLGIMLLISAQLFYGAQMILQEKWIADHKLNPLQVVGWEGFWGVLVCAIVLLPLFQHISCSGHMCINGKVEDSIQAFGQIDLHKVLILYIVLWMFSVSLFNTFGVYITKFTSATHRTTIQSCQVLSVWVVSIFLGWENFMWGQLFGFVLVAGGTLVFNEIIVIPFLLPDQEKHEYI